jgi:hypothetical protein
MADHSARPSLDHLRRQARDLLRAARAGAATAADRIRAVADALTLASAQLAVARQAEAFCEASIRDGTGSRAQRFPRDCVPSSQATSAGPRDQVSGGSFGGVEPRCDRGSPGVQPSLPPFVERCRVVTSCCRSTSLP